MDKSGGDGIGFVGLLTVLFVGLKLCNVIAWSWWWVLSPVLISAALIIAVIGVMVALGVFTGK